MWSVGVQEQGASLRPKTMETPARSRQQLGDGPSSSDRSGLKLVRMETSLARQLHIRQAGVTKRTVRTTIIPCRSILYGGLPVYNLVHYHTELLSTRFWLLLHVRN